jgi:hypothetical protein
MIFSGLCPPALIYLIYSVVQIGIDIIKGFYNTAFVKVWVAFVFTILLNYLCQSGLGIVSWIIIFLPFVLMAVIVSLLLFTFGLDAKSGKLLVNSPSTGTKKEEKPKNTANIINNDNSYGIDLSTNVQDPDQANIQKMCGPGKNQDSKFCQYTELINQQHGIRKRYAQEARDILINLNEPDKAASFMNDTQLTCMNNNTDIEFNECFITKCNEYADSMPNKKDQFIQKLKDKNIL